MLRKALRVISKSSHRTRDLPPVCFTPGSSLLSACQWDINPPPVSFNNLFLGLQQIPMSLKWAPTKYLAACFAINPQWGNREQIGWQQQQQQVGELRNGSSHDTEPPPCRPDRHSTPVLASLCYFHWYVFSQSPALYVTIELAPNPISQWTGHRGAMARNTMQPVNTKHCRLMQCACVSTGFDIIVKHSSVPFDIPKHNACEPASCSQNWKAEEEKLSNHGPPPKCAFNLYKLEEQVPSKQITAEDVCDKQNICKPDLFQNYETTMGAPLGDTVYSYHLSTLLHASPLIWANMHCDRNSNKYCCKCNSSYHHSCHPTQSSNWCFSLDTAAGFSLFTPGVSIEESHISSQLIASHISFVKMFNFVFCIVCFVSFWHVCCEMWPATCFFKLSPGDSCLFVLSAVCSQSHHLALDWH